MATTGMSFGMTVSLLQSVGIIGMMTVEWPGSLQGILAFFQAWTIGPIMMDAFCVLNPPQNLSIFGDMNVAICNLFWFVLLLSEICVDLPYFPKVAIALKGQICWNETAGLALGHRQLLLQLFRRFWHCGTLSCQCQLLFPGASVAWWLKHIFYFNLPPHRWSCVMWGAIVFFFSRWVTQLQGGCSCASRAPNYFQRNGIGIRQRL